MQSVIDWLPGFAAVFGAKRARGRDRDEHSLRIFRIDQNRVQTHSARARLPFRTGIVLAETGQFVPRFAAVFRLEQRGVFHARVNIISVIERGLEVPDALELPRMLGAVVPHVRPGNAIVNEFVALTLRRAVRTFQILRTAAWRLPGFAAVAATLNDLPEPRARLRRVNPVRINRRPFHVINLPAGKMRPVHFPIFALRIRSQDERALLCTNQQSYSAHT